MQQDPLLNPEFLLAARIRGRGRPRHTIAKGKGQSDFSDWPLFNAGNDLLSHTLSRAVQSALRGLTSVFGMGTGGTPAVRSPTTRSCQLSAVSSQLFLAGATFRADGQQTW